MPNTAGVNSEPEDLEQGRSGARSVLRGRQGKRGKRPWSAQSQEPEHAAAFKRTDYGHGGQRDHGRLHHRHAHRLAVAHVIHAEGAVSDDYAAAYGPDRDQDAEPATPTAKEGIQR